MGYRELIEKRATEPEIKSYLAEGNQIAVTFRIPENLKEAAAVEANQQGMSFSAFIRNCLINELLKR